MDHLSVNYRRFHDKNQRFGAQLACPKHYQADPRPASCLTDMTTTANVLTTRIELCDVLLGEISGIRSSLAKDLQRTREPPLALI